VARRLQVLDISPSLYPNGLLMAIATQTSALTEIALEVSVNNSLIKFKPIHLVLPVRYWPREGMQFGRRR
jgi:hypothetical protein